MISVYQRLRDIIRSANGPNILSNRSVSVDVEFLNSVFVMVEELRDNLEHVQKLKGLNNYQTGIASFLINKSIDHADLISEKYWSEEKYENNR